MFKKELEKRFYLSKYKQFFESFLGRIPESMMPYVHMKVFEPREQVISAIVRSTSVYFLMKGKMYAVEEYVQSQPYIFTELNPIDIVGDFELFSETEYSYATIIAAERCECIAMPSELYLNWVSQDSLALFYRTGLLMKMLGKQTAEERQFFYMDYKTRCVSVLLQHSFSEDIKEKKMTLTREILSGKIGCSLRTCQRIIKELESEDMVHIVHGKIAVSREQHMKMEEYLKEKKEHL